MIKREFMRRIIQAAGVAKAQGARFNLAVLCAQAALESCWGNSGLTKRACNLFGIKASRGSTGPTVTLMTREYVPQKGWIKVPARWRVYATWAVCILDYAHLIATRPWYQDALQYLDDPDQFLAHLLPGFGDRLGWATDPNYVGKVRQCADLIEDLGGPKWARKRVS